MGYTPEEFTGEHFPYSKIIHPDDLERVSKEVNYNVHNNIDVYEQFYRLKNKNGEYRWIYDFTKLIRDQDGQILSLRGYLTDRTDRQVLEDSLLKSEARLVGTQSIAKIGSWDLDLVNNKLTWSDEIYRIFELDKSFFKPSYEHFLNAIHPEDLVLVDTAYHNSLISKHKYEVEHRLIMKDGRIKWVREICETKFDDSGNGVISRGTVQDITEDKLKSQELLAVKERLELVMDGANDGFWDWNMYTKEAYFSRRYKEIVGYKDDELENNISSFGTLIHQADREKIANEIQEYYNCERTQHSTDLRLIHKDGSIIWVTSKGRVTLDENGKPYRISGTITDISVCKKNKELMLFAQQKAELANKDKSEFLAIMSHEIRTRLNGVIGFNSLLLNTKLDYTQQQYAEDANTSGQALLNVINNTLDLSKIESGDLDLDITNTDLVTILEQAIDIVKYQACKKNLELIFNISPEVPHLVKLDSGRLKQILINLLNNAIKFTEKGEVELKVAFDDLGNNHGNFAFSVRDTGIGMPLEQQDKIFEDFVQGDRSITRKFGGTGLGLHIANLLAEKMGSQIKLITAVGAGSTFSFEIIVEYVQLETANFSLKKKYKHLLLVDDNSHNLNILHKQLTYWQINTLACSSSIQAIELLQGEHDFDSMVINLQIGEMNGLEVVSHIRRKLRISEDKFPIILLYNYFDENVYHNINKSSLLRSFLKPVKPRELYQFMRDLSSSDNELGAVEELSTINARKLNILIAEDVKMNLLLIKTILLRLLYNANITEAVNGKQALYAFRQQPFDLVLMDVQMPEMDGLMATKLIREYERTTNNKRVPIVALTAGALKEELDLCFASGMDDTVTKPISPDLIIKMLNNLFPRLVLTLKR